MLCTHTLIRTSEHYFVTPTNFGQFPGDSHVNANEGGGKQQGVLFPVCLSTGLWQLQTWYAEKWLTLLASFPITSANNLFTQNMQSELCGVLISKCKPAVVEQIPLHFRKVFIVCFVPSCLQMNHFFFSFQHMQLSEGILYGKCYRQGMCGCGGGG